MKTTLNISRIICYTLIISLFSCKNAAVESEEEEEGMPVVFNALNDWSAMRTYPNKKMVAASFNEANNQMYRMNARHRNAKGTAVAALSNWTALAPKTSLVVL